jgi:hypothetical protein
MDMNEHILTTISSITQIYFTASLSWMENG